MEKISYDLFARDYHNKRRHHWKDLDIFLQELIKKGIQFRGYNLDLGCANGRNFDLFLNSNSKLVGIDNSIELLRLARDRLDEQSLKSNFNPNSVNLILSDLKALPLRPNAIKNIFSIATVHHIETNALRSETISQLYTILKENGFFVLTVWRRYQKKYRFIFSIDWLRRVFIPKHIVKQNKLGLLEFGDKFIPWTLSNKNLTYNRFYHFFSLKEIKSLLKSYLIKAIAKRGGPNRKDNFFVLSQKVVKEKIYND